MPAPFTSGRAPVAHVLTIGDELLAGDVVDRNLAFLAGRCRTIGLTLRASSTVRDRVDEIVEALHRISAHADVCLVSGGLGPTTDDLTSAAVAAAAGVSLVRDEAAVGRIEAKFRLFGRPMPDENRKQADFPAGSEILANPIGTAEGHTVAFGTRPCRVFVMPGVPRELQRMMLEQVEPRLRAALLLSPVVRRIYRILGHGESAVAERVEPIVAAARQRASELAGVFVHYRASMPEVTVALEGLPGPEGRAADMEALAGLDAEMVEALVPGMYGIGEADLSTRVVRAAAAAGLWIGVAESCTGGGLGSAITSVPGSSACFRGGVIAYDDAVKVELLGVDPAVLAEHGAVSEPVAVAMARGIRRALACDLAVAITGVAGPDGGTADKPVGTVHVAVADGEEIFPKRLTLRGDRSLVRHVSVRWAHKLLWDRLVARGAATISACDD